MRVLVHADDLGMSMQVNDAVFRALERGIASSASVLVTGPALLDATARGACGLDLGVHLDITEFPALTEAAPLAALRATLGARPAGARRALEGFAADHPDLVLEEWAAQVAHLRSLGVEPTHVDSHQHVHTLPAYWPILRKLLTATGIRGVRGVGAWRPDVSRLRGTLQVARAARFQRAFRSFVVPAGFVSASVARALLGEGRLRVDTLEVMVHPGNPHHARYAEELAWLETRPWPRGVGAVTWGELVRIDWGGEGARAPALGYLESAGVCMIPEPVRASDPATFPAEVDVAVIGGGPAGTTAAALLHQRGWRTCVVEAEQFPRFVIGESLLARCMDLLDEAGMLDAVKSRDYLVKRGALFVRGNERADIDFADQFTPGWTWTWQVPRADFDVTLANCAVAQGVPIYYGHRVTGMTPGGAPELTIEGPSGRRSLRARHVIDASGYGRVLPRLLGLDRPSSLVERRSLFAHVRGDRRPPGALENRIWIVMHPKGAWIWVIPFSDGTTSVGFVAEPSFYDHWSGTDEDIFRAALAEDPNTRDRLADMELLFAPRVIQGYSASVSQFWGPGYTLVGNATEFLDPVFSSGVTLALESANRAAKLVDQQLRGEPVEWDEAYSAYMARGVETFRAFVLGWYDGDFPAVLFSTEQNRQIRQQITSVLAGYVWDTENPFVREPERRLKQIARIVRHLNA